MKKFFTLNLFLLIAVFSISQDVYPKLAVINNDTLALLKPIDVQTLNVVFIQLDTEKALNAILTEQISIQKQQLDNQQLIKQKSDSIFVKSLLIESEQLGQINSLSLIVKKQQKQIVILKKSRTLLIIGSGIVGVIGTYLIMKP